jgi:quercetin dioxygenase-like cupin family protein
MENIRCRLEAAVAVTDGIWLFHGGGRTMDRRYVVGFITFIAGAAFGIGGLQVLSAQAGGGLPSTKMILRTDLQNIPGQEVLVFASEWSPGNTLPLHIHPDGHEFVYVVEGEQTFHIQGVGVKTVKAGEVLYRPPNVPHFGQNATAKLSKTIVFRIKDKAQPISVDVNK